MKFKRTSNSPVARRAKAVRKSSAIRPTRRVGVDHDAKPALTAEDANGFRPMARIKKIRHRLRMSQEQFAATYHIPVGTLRDWEQHRSEPDTPGLALIDLIDSDPERIAAMLKRATVAAE